MAEAGQSKQALENLKLWAGIFSCSRSPNTQFRELGPLRKAETFSIYTSQVQPPTEKGQFVPNHKTRTVSNIISIVILESVFFFWWWWCVCVCVFVWGWFKGVIFSREFYAVGIPSACVSVACLHLSLYFLLSLPLTFPRLLPGKKAIFFFFFFPRVC